MRNIVIGDVHGCHQELITLIKDLEISKTDRIIFLGDLIHKGPESVEVVDYVYNLRQQGYQIIYVGGNHEEKHLRWYYSNKKHRFKHVEDYPTFDFKQYHYDFMADHFLYYKFDDYIAVHGGLTNSHIISQPSLHVDEFKQLPKKLRNLYKTMYRLRYVDQKNNMVALGNERKEHNYWADIYNGHAGYALFGHQAFIGLPDPNRFAHALTLDTGAVYGGYLTAAIINSTRLTTHSVQSKQYCIRPKIAARSPS